MKGGGWRILTQLQLGEGWHQALKAARGAGAFLV